MLNERTGYPSIDQPWKSFYSKEYSESSVEAISMYDYLVRCNQDNLSGTALNYYGTKLTYQEFFEEVEKAAKAFKALGVKEGDIVTVVTLTTIKSIITMYALNRIGAVNSYVNVLAKEDEFETYFREAESKFVITLDLFGEKVLAAAKKAGVKSILVYSLKDDMPFWAKLAYTFKAPGFDKTFLKDPLFIRWKTFISLAQGEPATDYVKDGKTMAFFGHTGGTTGFPKNVMLNDYSFNHIANCCLYLMDRHKKGDVFLNGMIPYVIYSTMINIHFPLAKGLEMAIVPNFEPKEWHQYIKMYRPNVCSLIPAYAQGMLMNENLKHTDLSCLKTFGIGGEGLTDTMEEEINHFLKDHHSNARLTKGYGMTEVGSLAIMEVYFARKVGSVGIPLLKNNLMIYDNEQQKECTYNEKGEICMQCESAMMGYKDCPDEMAILFRTHPDGSVWIHTGDLGYIDEEGFLFVIGRLKRMIMTVGNGRAYKVAPQLVETVLERSPHVHAVCVVGASDGTDKVLKAFVVPNDGADADILINDLKKIAAAELQDNMQPTFYEICDRLPRTPAGKIDYQALEKMTEA